MLLITIALCFSLKISPVFCRGVVCLVVDQSSYVNIVSLVKPLFLCALKPNGMSGCVREIPVRRCFFGGEEVYSNSQLPVSLKSKGRS